MNGFNRLARPYRWMEYVTFGRALERCRFHFLPQLVTVHNALLLGDGDGRFAARLLQISPHAHVHAVDGSEAMLAALQSRCGGQATTYCADLSRGVPVAIRDVPFDLVSTHFFLDCLSASEIDRLATELRPLLKGDARWLVSEFAVPQHGAMRWIAALVVRWLYLSFRMLTGLRTQQLPAYRPVLEQHGFVIAETKHWMGGLLVSELWQFTALEVTRSPD
jgi:ubiquinone/menaquinone biosynthesis C-methylase UbiE